MLQHESLRTWQASLAARAQSERKHGRLLVLAGCPALTVIVLLFALVYLPDRNEVVHHRSAQCMVANVTAAPPTVTWAVRVDNQWYYMVDDHVWPTLTAGHTQDCYYDDREPSHIRFDGGPTDRMASMMVLIVYFGGVSIIILGMGISVYCGWIRDRESHIETPPEAGPYEFMLGHHPRVGRRSSLYRHFRKSGLYDRHLSSLILSFLDPALAPMAVASGEDRV